MKLRLALAACCVITAAPCFAHAQLPDMPEDDRVRLAEAMRLSERVGERVWPGWRSVPMAVLLVGDSVEYLVGHPAPSSDFASLGRDPLLGTAVLARRRVFAPAMLATFPAVGGIPTIVVGGARATGKRSAEWVVTLLHEHFHQMQYAQPGYYAGVAALDLARGDTTGMWMLDYAFPYDSTCVATATARLGAALDAGSSPEVTTAWRELTALLAPADRRYLEFQLWQEGVARWVEYAATRMAARDGSPPSAAFRALPDFENYEALAQRQRRALHEELQHMPLAERRRVAFYPLGAAMATLLDGRSPNWKRRYEAAPFRIGSLLVDAEHDD